MLPSMRWLPLVIALAGCGEIGDWATEDDERYRGTVIGVDDPGSLRRGFASETELTMTFDPNEAESLTDPPGVLTTSDGSLTNVPLEPITPLTHDVLSDYEIPEGDRVRNYIFVTRPEEGPLAGREPMVFVSLMGDGSIEVRIIAGGGNRDGDYFGVFRLRRD